MNNFGDQLDSYMKRIFLTDNKLTRLIDVGRMTVWRWRNNVTRPSCENVRKMIDILRLTPEEAKGFSGAAGYGEAKPPCPPYLPVIGISMTSPCQFFGRETVLKHLYNAWQNERMIQNVAILGPSGTGKTSLLNYLNTIVHTPATELRKNQPNPGWPAGWLPTHFQRVLIKLGEVGKIRGPADFLLMVLKGIGQEKQIDWVKNWEASDLLFSVYDILRKQKKVTVVFLDDIEKGLNAPEFNTRFWHQLRSLAQETPAKLRFVVTAKDTRIIQSDYPSSPFFNIFNIFWLDPFTKAEASDFFQHSPIPLTLEEQQWMITASRGWPVLLQILCQARINCPEGDFWKEVGLKNVEPFGYLLKR